MPVGSADECMRTVARYLEGQGVDVAVQGDLHMLQAWMHGGRNLDPVELSVLFDEDGDEAVDAVVSVRAWGLARCFEGDRAAVAEACERLNVLCLFAHFGIGPADDEVFAGMSTVVGGPGSGAVCARLLHRVFRDVDDGWPAIARALGAWVPEGPGR